MSLPQSQTATGATVGAGCGRARAGGGAADAGRVSVGKKRRMTLAEEFGVNRGEPVEGVAQEQAAGGGEDAKPTATIWTDGACLGNPGYGGWGAVIVIGDQRKEHSGEIEDDETTNMRAELIAVIEALKLLGGSHTVTVYCDNKTTVKCARRENKRKANKDLWVTLDTVEARHTVAYEWIKREENKIADALASAAAQSRKQRG